MSINLWRERQDALGLLESKERGGRRLSPTIHPPSFVAEISAGVIDTRAVSYSFLTYIENYLPALSKTLSQAQECPGSTGMGNRKGH